MAESQTDVSNPAEILVKELLFNLGEPFFLAQTEGRVCRASGFDAPGFRAYVPAFRPENFGDRSFLKDYGLRYAYVGGSMANGISSVQMAQELGRAGMLGFYGAAGNPFEEIEKAVVKIQSETPDIPYGFNLINSPSEPENEFAVSDLYIRRGVRLVEASAYIMLTLPLVRYRLSGIKRLPSGEIFTPNRVMAKVSRVEVAERFFSPAPAKLVRELVQRGDMTAEQAELAALVPVAQDVTAEADSGGHTDNRPAITLLPTILALRDAMQARYGYPVPLRVGLGGGISTPSSAAGAFMMGAAYVVTGSVNQACTESGTSDAVRLALSQAGQADVAMAPAADMFEMGVKVQILKRGTMFAMRAAKLYELYRAYNSFEDIPQVQRAQIENDFFRMTFAQVWEGTRNYFLRRDPSQAERAERDSKHKMALVFRWYLSRASRWAIEGNAEHKMDYQIWCGPSLGAFNEWSRGSFMEKPEGRKVANVAFNLLAGAAVTARAFMLQAQGVNAGGAATFSPKTDAELKKILA